jgi:hypothetical protein
MFCDQCGAENRDTARFCANCGANTSVSPPPKPPDWLDSSRTEQRLMAKYVLAGRYEIQRELGAGGLGIVYLAYDQSLDMTVAIKVLKTLLASDPQAVDDLKKEARIAMGLSHKNIMRVHNFEDNPDVKFLTMEYIDGTTLAELKVKDKSGHLSCDVVVGYVKQICEGLSYAHEQKIVHRDIKPANLMLNQQGVIKIADFGIARVAKDSASRLSNIDTSGTLMYMSPEQMKGKGIDVQSDLYSLGATVYELLSGQPPFSTGDIRYQILNEPPEPIPGMPDRINEFLLKALAKDKEQRWQSAREMIDALEGRIELPTDRQQREEEERRQQEELRRREEAQRREQQAREAELLAQKRLEEERRQEQQRQAAARAEAQRRADEVRRQQELERQKAEEAARQRALEKKPKKRSRTVWASIIFSGLLILLAIIVGNKEEKKYTPDVPEPPQVVSFFVDNFGLYYGCNDFCMISIDGVPLGAGLWAPNTFYTSLKKGTHSYDINIGRNCGYMGTTNYYGRGTLVVSGPATFRVTYCGNAPCIQ